MIAWLVGNGALVAQPCTMTAQIVSDPPTPGVVCSGDMITISAVVTGGTGPFTYDWSNGETTPSFMVAAPYSQTLVLDVTDAEGCTAMAILHVKIDVLDFYIGYDMTPACAGDVITLVIATTVTLPGLEYLWSTGETTPTIEVSTSGTYTATLTHPSLPCEAVHSVDIVIHPDPGPEPEIIGPAMLCPGQMATLSVNGGPFNAYSWSTGDNTPTTEIIGPGFITVVVENAVGCTGTDDIEIIAGSVEALLNTPEPICPGQSTVIEVLNAGDFDGFEWSTGETTASITVNTPGSYSVTASAGTCTSVVTVEVVGSGGVIDLLAASTAVTSCTTPNGAIDLTVSPPGVYSFDWSGGQSTEDVSNLQAGSYSVTVTDPDGCSATGTFDVEDDTALPAASVTITAASCQQANGAIDLTVSPPGSYGFVWSNGVTTEDLSNVAAATYTVTITSMSTGCMHVVSYTVDNVDPQIILSGVATPLTSCTMPNGAIDLTPEPAGMYAFAWSSGVTTEDLQDLPAGTYSVTVSAGGSCTATASFIVDNGTTAPILDVGVMPAMCGLSNGSIDITADPPGAYTYAWSGGESTEDLFGLPPGIYAVTVTAPDGCATSDAIDVPDESFMPTLSAIITNNTSCTGGNGAIDLSVDPSGTYVFSWSTGELTEDLAGLPAGAYLVTVTLGTGCQADGTFLVDDMTDTLAYAAVVTPNGSCTSPDGSIDLTLTTPGSVEFLWSNGATTEDIDQLSGGTYSVTMTDDQGCSTTAAFTVMNTQSTFVVMSAVSANTSCVQANGAIDITVNPPGTYGFLWSNGAMSEDLPAVAGGVYGLTVTDASTCALSMEFTVPDSLLFPQLTAAIDTADCATSSGAIHLLVAPASGNAFLWSTGAVTQDLIAIGGGTYAVTVTSAAGCMRADTFNVPARLPAFTISGMSTASTSCVTPDGAIDLMVDPPGAYVFSWMGGQTSEDVTGLGAGSYSVTVTDGMGCTVDDTFVVTSSLLLPELAGTASSALCTTHNGMIDLTVTPPGVYVYAWSNGAITEDVMGLAPGIYGVEVTDVNGCESRDTFTVDNAWTTYMVDGAVWPDTSCVAGVGQIDLDVTPGGSFSFLWSTGQTSEDLSGLESGAYSITVTDAFGCTAEAAFDVADGVVVPFISGQVTSAMCGRADGAIELTVSPSGVYLFAWSSGQFVEDLGMLPAGAYTVTVTGSGGCQASASFDVPSTGTAFGLTGTPAANTTCSSFNGAIDLEVSPAGIYAYSWSNGSVVEDLLAVPPGAYFVTVTDEAGCSATASFDVADQPDIPSILGTVRPSTCGLPTGAVDLQVMPADGNVFLWSTGSTTEDLDGLDAGHYSVTVTGPLGCVSIATFELSGEEPVEISLTAGATPLGDDLVLIQAEVNLPLSGLDTIIWLPESLFSCMAPFCTEQAIPIPAQPTLVRVIAVDTNGCSAEARLELRRDIDPSVYLPNVFTPNGDGINDGFTVYGNEDVELVIELQIFDRWGNFVFRNANFPPNLETLGWDGRFRGQDMNPAVFAFWARVRFVDGTERAYKGDVTLLR